MNTALHKILSNPKLPFAQKLQIAADSPNLAVHEFKRILPLVPVDVVPTWEPRHSQSGKHGSTGEKRIFKFDFEILLLGETHSFFLKGYFFEKDNLRGVEIQSFRREPL
jgi:hypothetical protein